MSQHGSMDIQFHVETESPGDFIGPSGVRAPHLGFALDGSSPNSPKGES